MSIVRLIRDPVGRGRDPVVNAWLSGLATREASRHKTDEHPTSVSLLNLDQKLTVKSPPSSTSCSPYHEWSSAVALARVLAALSVARAHHLRPDVDLKSTTVQTTFSVDERQRRQCCAQAHVLSLSSHLNSCVPVPVFTSLILQHWHVDDLKHARPLNLRHQELNEWPGDIVRDQSSPPGDIRSGARFRVSSSLGQADGRHVGSVVHGAVQREHGNVVPAYKKPRNDMLQ